jgi:DNA-binding NtrC family response regulator
MTTVLIVDDEKSIREGLTRAIARAGHQTVAAANLAEARAALARGSIDCVLLDIRLPDGDGLGLLAEIRRDQPRVPVIMATAYGDSERAIAAMSAGAFEYLTKPFDFDALLATVGRAVRASAATRESARPSESGAVPALIGGSPRMLEVWKAIGRAAASDAPVLITGESGTGKELVARAVHDHGPRRGEPFVAVNLAALPGTLIESELFGHEKGAFTGAERRREGRFEQAGRGTIFLDEIGDLDLPLQTKLLRVLQEGTLERLGSGAPISTHARVIAATSKPVDPRTPGATLREDLFYRLGVIRIEVPPLRDRRSDIPLLVEGYLRRRAKTPDERRAVSDAAMRKLSAHGWPGNVRELLHVVERACVMSPSEVLDADDFDVGAPAQQRPSGVDPASLDLRASVDALERDLVTRALKKAQGNRAEAARLLGIARPQLYAKMKQLGIDPDE